MATSLVRRNPFGAIDSLNSRMWDWFATPMGMTPMSKLFGEMNGFVPPIDLFETREEILLSASLPGLEVAQLNIEVHEDQVTLSGEQQPFFCFEPQENAVHHLAGIPRYGKFSFDLQLPCAVDAEQAQANYKDGLLCVRFLKAQKARPVRVRVHSAEVKPAVGSTQAEAVEAQASAERIEARKPTKKNGA